MNLQRFLPVLCLLAGLQTLPATAQTSVASSPDDAAIARYASIRQEILHSIDKGNAYLKSRQAENGTWADPSYPALTALAVTAAMRAPDQKGKPLPEYLKKSYDFILKSQKEDGSIFNRGLASYNTSVCMLALLAANNAAYDQPLLKARAYLVRQQSHFAPDSPYHGGIGYGGADAPPIADLSNTSLALEAVYYSKKLAQDGKYGEQPELDWNAAAEFVSRCQQKPEATSDPAQAGGFMYRPAGSEKVEVKGSGGRATAGQPGKPGHESAGRRGNSGQGGGRGGLGGAGKGMGEDYARAYGSMTYAGMQSLIYADLGKNDPRVKSALEWLANNYSVDENPGVGIQGLYYYYQSMAKALSAAGIDFLKLADGHEVDWRDNLADKLISIQKPDGSWVNTNNRWWEADPILVTAYSVLALEQIYNSIPIHQ